MLPPADEPHGTSHLSLAYVLGAHVADGFRGAVDMLTRTGHESDFAPDASVFPAARDPETGRRQLEQLAFEIVGEQWIGIPSEKARELTRRGVRRVFCVVLKTGRVLEWSRDTDGWAMLADDSQIEDACLARPLPICALVDATEADRAVVLALRARGLLDEIELRSREEGREEGRLAARREAVRDLCEVLDIPMPPERAQELEALDDAGLTRVVTHIKQHREWP